MDDKRLVKASKYLSRHLRHDPARLGLTLQPGGWVDVDELLTALRRANFALTRADLDEVVARNDKRRFAFDETGTRIRASQGHSIGVDLGLEPTEPPDFLFHGTGAGSVDSILAAGLHTGGRDHVHLSTDVETARKVGGRHGKPVVLRVDAGRMHEAGHTFYVSDNGVWLTRAVPAEFLSLARPPSRPAETSG